MARTTAFLCLLAAGTVTFFPGPAPRAADRKKAGEKPAPPVNDLSLEVAALQALHYFQFTRDQTARLRKLAPETAEKPRRRKPAKASRLLREALADLRDALVADEDDERIDKLGQGLADLQDVEKPDLDDAVEVTAAARKHAPEVLRRLSAGQVAGYIAAYAEEVRDPRELLTDALAKSREMKAGEWKEYREQVAESVGLMVAGLDEDGAEKAGSKALALLARARGLGADEYKKRRPELEKQIDQLIGRVGPTDVLRHLLEYALAELLSNPRLAAVLKARRK